jgi:hypothetical protein
MGSFFYNSASSIFAVCASWCKADTTGTCKSFRYSYWDDAASQYCEFFDDFMYILPLLFYLLCKGYLLQLDSGDWFIPNNTTNYYYFDIDCNGFPSFGFTSITTLSTYTKLSTTLSTTTSTYTKPITFTSTRITPGPTTTFLSYRTVTTSGPTTTIVKSTVSVQMVVQPFTTVSTKVSTSTSVSTKVTTVLVTAFRTTAGPTMTVVRTVVQAQCVQQQGVTRLSTTTAVRTVGLTIVRTVTTRT